MPSAWANVRAYPGRFLAVLLAIAIGVGFTVATLVFTASFRTDLARSIGAAADKVDVIVYPQDALSADDPRLIAVQGVASAEPMYSTGVQFTTAGARGWLGVETVAVNPALRWFELSSGSWPTGIDQVVVDPATAARNNLTVGTELSLSAGNETSYPVTVVGFVDLQRSSLTGAYDEVFAAPELAGSLAGQLSEIDLLAAPGVTAEELAESAGAAFGAAAEVKTGEQVVAQQVSAVLGATDILGTVLLSFAAVAGLVASFVIANTFAILLAQRQRQIGLMRCVGASRRQIRRSVLTEALLVGTMGSAAGALAGIGFGRLAMIAARVSGASFTVQFAGLAIAMAIGISVTVLAALAPARRAMQVTPLAALSAVPTVEEIRRSGRIRLILGWLLVVTGGLGMLAGMFLPSLLVAVGSGAVSAAGVLLLMRSVVPLVLRGIGRLARVGGVPGRLAAANAERNPSRAAATSTALVIAVGLIVTLQVAAASAQASLKATLAAHYPLDVSILTDQPPADADAALPANLLDQLGAIDGLTTMALSGTSAEVTAPELDSPMTVIGVPPNVDTVIRSGPLANGTVAVPRWMLSTFRMNYGDLVTIQTSTGSTTLKVADSRLAYGQDSVLVVTAADLTKLDPAAQSITVWGKLADIDDANAVISQIKPLLAPYPTLDFGGAAADHVSVGEGLNTILLVVTVLLGVAALIAVVGIGNTLGLSVVERTRESALLRALGLRRGQLRLMLAVEAVLLAAVGALIGILLGTGYGWVGAAVTFSQANEQVVLAFPGWQVLLVLGLALLAGVAASVLPARRAAMAAPTDALAEV